MDIRSFFKKRGGESNPKKRKSTSGTSIDPNAAGESSNDVPVHESAPRDKGKKTKVDCNSDGCNRIPITATDFFSADMVKDSSSSSALDCGVVVDVDSKNNVTGSTKNQSEENKESKSIVRESALEIKDEITTVSSSKEIQSPMMGMMNEKPSTKAGQNFESSNGDGSIVQSNNSGIKVMESGSESFSKETVAKQQTIVPPEPSKFYSPSQSLSLSGLTFVLTGVLDDVSRDSLQEFILIHGGRITNQVSGKTNFLVAGDLLEDGRNVESGSKFRMASEKDVQVVRGINAFNMLIRKIDEGEIKSPAPVSKASPKMNPYSKVSNVSNPYAKVSNNPYAKKMTTNPYTTNPYASKASSAKPTKNETKLKTNTSGMLWADAHAPTSTRDILGNGDAVSKLHNWLSSWEKLHLQGKKSSTPRAALLSGPPGIGKTTTATLVAKELGRDVLELNASDTRSKKSLQEQLGDVTGSHVLSFAPKNNVKKGSSDQSKKNRCIIMDEVDGMGAGDRSGMSELIQMIKKSKVPIICICNDRQSQKLKSLVPYCLDLKYRRPTKGIIARRAIQIAKMHSLEIEQNAAEALAESCGNDIRQVLNALQMWGSGNRRTMTYADYSAQKNAINKDESLRVSLFDATKLIVEGSRGDDSFWKRYDAFFVDYSFIGLLVHQNYIKVITPQYLRIKAAKSVTAEEKLLERMSAATDTMSDFDLVEGGLRGEQNWGLLPFCASLCVQTGFIAGGPTGGFLSSFPEFTTYLGKNSTRGKKRRILGDLKHHMNFKVSSSAEELRMMYLPALHSHFYNSLQNDVEATINEMDSYGINRDDLFESFDEFSLAVGGQKSSKFGDLDSKVKAAFTREYNKSVHKAQALVSEQGVSGKKRKVASQESSTLEENDEDAVDIDDDANDEDDLEKVQAMFKKKGRGSTKSATGKKKGSNSKKKKLS